MSEHELNPTVRPPACTCGKARFAGSPTFVRTRFALHVKESTPPTTDRAADGDLGDPTRPVGPADGPCTRPTPSATPPRDGHPSQHHRRAPTSRPAEGRNTKETRTMSEPTNLARTTADDATWALRSPSLWESPDERSIPTLLAAIGQVLEQITNEASA